MKSFRWVGSLALIASVAAAGVGLAAWKRESLREASAAAASQPEPTESITSAVAREREHRRTTTAIGTVLALRSITLRNEIAGTVSHTALTTGQIVEAGTVLVALDVSVEEAELKSFGAQTALAESTLKRMQSLATASAVSEMDLDRARAERDVALALIARTKAVMARKTLLAPFRARIGMANLHPGQYLEAGTDLTTLQGVDKSVHVDFTVTQNVATGLQAGDEVEVYPTEGKPPVAARIIAIDARVDSKTRNAGVRVKIEDGEFVPSPGASVRVRVPVDSPRMAVAIPVTALRRGPQGDHVFVLTTGQDGKTRAHLRGVKSGAVQGDEVLIETGLAVGERVAASGSFKLREAVLVTDVGKS